jgi:hypothetical protein
MAYTQAQVDALEDAIAEGVLTVEMADRSVTYRSLEEMSAILDRMKDELGLNSAKVTRKYFSHSKGL